MALFQLHGYGLGIGFSLLCFELSPPKSRLEQLFDFRTVQVVIPAAIMVVFFWGLLIYYFRRQRLGASEKVATTELAATVADLLVDEGPAALLTQMDHPDTDINPLLRRLKALLAQWQLKPGLVEADLVLQQFIADDEEDTRRAYSLVRTFVWALPVLGLIGTVLGIAFAVGGFASFLGGNVDNVDAIKKSLVGVTGGLSFAFLLTLLGLATSLILMLLASGLETREERLHQSIQQHVVASFLPVLQRADNGKTEVETLAGSLSVVSETVLNHVAKLAEVHIARLSGLLEEQQKQVSAWGHGLHTEAASAAAVVKISLDDTAKNLGSSGSEFLARLDLVRQTWKEQTDILKSELNEQTKTNQGFATQLQAAAQQQVQASQSLATTLSAMQTALAATATSIQSLESGLVRLADSPLEATATALVKSLEKVGEESERITTTLAALTTNTRLTAEAQASIHAAVKQLDDIKLVETMASFRDALTRHAGIAEKLIKGVNITLS